MRRAMVWVTAWLAGAGGVLGQGPRVAETVKGKPLSLTQRTTQEAPPVDGSHAVVLQEVHLWRDSEGRERREILGMKEGELRTTSLRIVDPVAHTTTTLAPERKAAVVVHDAVLMAEEEREAEARRAGARRPGAGDAGFTTLAPRMIAGVEGEGTRRVMPLRAGARGGGGEGEMVMERWRSEELGIDLLARTDDARGRTTLEVVELTRGEPDAELFRVPADYKVEERQAPPRVTPPAVVKTKLPEFSDEARRQKISGSVLVGITVDEQGLPTKVRVLRGLGHGLDEKAVEAVSGYRFRPAMQGGKAVPVSMNIEVNFEIFDGRP